MCYASSSVTLLLIMAIATAIVCPTSRRAECVDAVPAIVDAIYSDENADAVAGIDC